MKSIKPGRGPSGMSFIGSIAAVIFGIFWTVMAAGMTANAPFGIGIIFPLFGVMFIVLGIVQAVYNYKNATGKNRYSIMDITDSKEEGDPADKWIDGHSDKEPEKAQQKPIGTEINYCPYCGEQLNSDYLYCPKCGKAIK